MPSKEPKKDPSTDDKPEEKEADKKTLKDEDKKEDSDKKDEDEKEGTPEKEEYDEEVIKSVAERLRFFFSDANVRQDFFIRKYLIVKEGALVGDSSISAGTVPIDALLRFNTIKRFTEDPADVIHAVKTVLSDKLVVKDEGKSIARVKPFTQELMNDNIPLSLYVKNLPTKQNDRKQVLYDVQMEDVRKLFESYGEVSLVKLRFKRSQHSDDDNHTDDIKMEDNEGKRLPRRRFPMGDCMVEFEEKAALEKAAEDVITSKEGAAVEPKRKLEMGEKTLEVMLLKDYLNGLKKRKRDKDDDKKGEDDGDASKLTIDWKPGCVVGLKGLPENCDREAILQAVMKGCDITEAVLKEKKIYADYSRGQKDGAIRFPEPDLPKVLVEKLKSGDVKICDAKVEEVEVKEGDAEKKYWEDYTQFKRNQMRHRQEEKKQKKKRFRRNKTM
ncbi:La domain [Seminavis robusta]|uniref:La domain n=1 Tax=Seminavis robusta TaxID=568900 RepID=A0A9N8DBE8_9STRA|nr:La domain [Seminavis robusta]|eukprot:Sro23_g016130.1 La domain (442) ;mRNA; f:160886-162211